MRERIPYIDLAKGLLICGVVMLHTGGVGIGQTILPSFFDLFMVPCFFMLSGYFCKNNVSVKELFVKKTNSLLIPYFIYILPVLVYNLMWWMMSDVADFSQVVAKSSIHNHPTWFIISLFFMAFIYKVLSKLFRSPNALVAVSCFISLAASYAKIKSLPVHIIYINAFAYLAYYTLGGYIARCNLSKFSLHRLFMISLPLFVSIALLNSMSGFGKAIISESPLFFVAAITGSICFMCLCKAIGHIGMFNYLGKNSLVILGMHQFCLFLVFRGMHINNPWIVFLLAMLLIVSLAFVCNRFFPIIAGKDRLLYSLIDHKGKDNACA